MQRIIVGLVLSLAASAASSDIWTSLFKEKLQEAKNGSAEAQYDVGSMYQNGRGVGADRNKAIEWYTRAAAAGESKAESRLNLMKANAERFSKTSDQASSGDIESQYDLGSMYVKGIGTNINYPAAIESFRKAAGQGHVKAAYKLGLIYYEGTGTRRNSKQAAKWFRQAANNGVPAAQYYLGKMYSGGHGVSRDYTQALMWLGKAVDGGFDQARGEMIDVSERMKMAEAIETEPETKKSVAKKPAKKQPVARKKTPAGKSTKTAGKKYSSEDLMLAAWKRDSKPVAWLPSSINTCRMEGKRMICFSDDQTRTAGSNEIKYKTKAIIENFSSKGSFKVSYRNLVISAKSIKTQFVEEDPDEMGSIDDTQPQSYAVKTGWGKTHDLECNMKNRGSVTCTKNGTYTIKLTSATGK